IGYGVVTGVHAVVRMLIALREGDAAAGRDTATFVAGYPGSPLAGLDIALSRAPGLASDHDIHLWSGVNEELAATAVWGTQTITAKMRPTHKGVIGVWFGKAPGLD